MVMLDIHMPDGTGFDLIEQLNSVNFEVIFTTGDDNYTMQAIKISALDYLLKPISVRELKVAIEKLEQKQMPAGGNNNLNILLHNLHHLNKQQHKVVLPAVDGFHVVQIKDIIRCESDSNYTTFVLTNGTTLTVSKGLKSYEQLLTDYDFYRTHKSHLINLHYVKKYARGNARFVIMEDDSQVLISKTKRENFLQIFNDLMTQ